MVPEDPLISESMESLSPLQQQRLSYQPPLPPILTDLKCIALKQQSRNDTASAELESLFPYTHSLPIVDLHSGTIIACTPLKIGIVFSGGPAPGGHNVLTGVFDAIKKLHPSSQLIGFLDGPGGIVKNQSIELTKEILAPFRNQGGFDCIGSGRTKIETRDQFDAVEKTLRFLQLDGLVIVGGDDSNTNAAFLAEFCKKKGLETRIIGVPKTIDGDLKNAFVEVSFGFDTASKTYAEMIGNLLKDCRSQKKYYFFVKMMGRSASHLTLECALKTHVNLALIGEEVAKSGYSLNKVVSLMSDLICARAALQKNYGVFLIPEGLLEFIPECQKMIEELNRFLGAKAADNGTNNKNPYERLSLVKENLSEPSLDCFNGFPQDIQLQLILDRDPHGNVQLSKIETERLLLDLVKQELSHRKEEGGYQGNFNAQPLFYGYEGRSGLPTNFDCNYCYSLGHLAALLIQHKASGYMCTVSNLTQPVEKWELSAVPIVKMLHFEMRKTKRQAVLKKALVNLEGSAFKRFLQKRTMWEKEDRYLCPGPIQFEGVSEVTDTPPLTLLLES